MSKQFWESRWESGQIGWDLGIVSPPLKAYISQLENKKIKILIPGCGNAYEAEYMLEQGFENVYIIELAKKAIDLFKIRCPLFPEDQIINGDFFELESSFDLVIEQTFFCAIIPDLRDQYVKKVNSLLNPNGKLVGVLFNRYFADGPPFGGDIAEYKTRFKSHFEILTMANCHNSISPRQGSEVFINLQKK
ncbi:MAG: methyltransferase domain-containing protein [Crocinitomicaceae bacterium]